MRRPQLSVTTALEMGLTERVDGASRLAHTGTSLSAATVSLSNLVGIITDLSGTSPLTSSVTKTFVSCRIT